MPFFFFGFRYVIYIYIYYTAYIWWYHMMSIAFRYCIYFEEWAQLFFLRRRATKQMTEGPFSPLAASRSGLILTSRQPLHVWPRGQKSKWLIYIYIIIHEGLELIEMNLLYISVYTLPQVIWHTTPSALLHRLAFQVLEWVYPIILQDWSHCQRKVLSTGKGVKMWTLVRKGLQCYATCLKSLRPGNGWWTFVVSNICC